MLERSAEAPHTWGMEHTEAAVREVVLDLQPDLVLYQELPGLVPFTETHGLLPANPLSHHGNLATLIRHDLLGPNPPGLKVVTGCAILAHFASMDLTVANVHLAPGKAGADERLHQMSQIVAACTTGRLVIVGDTNTRLAEAASYAELGLQSTKPPAATWDSRRNRFHPEMPEFSAYFTRWFAGGPVAVADVAVRTEPTTADGQRFHLSDHYAMTGRISCRA